MRCRPVAAAGKARGGRSSTSDTSERTTNKALIRILVVISTPYRTTRRYRSAIVRPGPTLYPPPSGLTRVVDQLGNPAVALSLLLLPPAQPAREALSKVRGRFCSTSKEAEREPARCRVLCSLLDKLGWQAATGRRLGVVMTVQRHDRPHPYIERTFTAVRAALPAANLAAFDTQLEGITPCARRRLGGAG
jgi:hypothetical protein